MGNAIRLLSHLFLTFTLVPLLGVLGQHVISSVCWTPSSIPVCAPHTRMGYLLTYLATTIGLLLLSPFWAIMDIDEPTRRATQFAAGPLGSLALWWLMDGDNGNDSRLLGPFWILLATAVGQGIVWTISDYHALPEQPQRMINDFGGRESKRRDILRRLGGNER